MKKIIFVLTLFMIFGGIAIGQETSREYIGSSSGDQVIPEDLIENEQEFYYTMETTDQYSGNIKKLGRERIRELIEEGLIIPQSFTKRDSISSSPSQYPGGPAAAGGPEYKPAAPKAP